MEPSNPTRDPARERFAALAHLIDLPEAARSLLAESNPGHQGHRQIALHKTSHTTIALFAFEAGGVMPLHQAHGAVIIQALSGHLTVVTAEGAHEVTAGRVLVLAPDVPHDVTAQEASQMLLTVSLAPPKV